MNKNYTLLSLIISFSFSLQAQDFTSADKDKTKSTNCKDLVFNTVELTPFEFNLRCKTEAYPFISKDGKHLYFTNNQTVDWIFYSERETSTGKWTVPVPITIEGYKGSIRSCYLNDDQSVMYIVGDGKLQRCNAVNGSKTEFNGLEEIYVEVNGDHGARPFSYLSFCDNMNTMYAYVGTSDEFLTMRKFVKTGDRSYELKGKTGFAKVEMGMISEDGQTYFYTDEKYPNILLCRRWDTTINGFGSTVYVVKEFESHLDFTQVRFAPEANLMVLVLSENSWDKNDLYFLDFNFAKETLDNLRIFDQKVATNANPVLKSSLVPENTLITLEEIDSAVAAPIYYEKSVLSNQQLNDQGASRYKLQLGQPFPNPAKNVFYIYYNVYSEDASKNLMPTLYLLDNSGRTVLTLKLDGKSGEAKVEFSHLAAGNYLVRIDYDGISSETVRISIQP